MAIGKCSHMRPMDKICDPCGRYPKAYAEVAALQEELARLNAIVNTPQADDFLRAVSTEAEHQRQRWGSEHDAGKLPEDWFWLIGYLAGKALRSFNDGDLKKTEHHFITTAAALKNWSEALNGQTSMRPGLSQEAAQVVEATGDGR